MQKRVLYYSTPHRLWLDNGCIMSAPENAPDKPQRIAIDDIGYIVLENMKTTVSLNLVAALAESNVALIFCDRKAMPVAMLQNLDSNTSQGERFREQIDASEPLKKNLWKQIVEAKIRNQAALLRKLDKNGDKLKPLYMNVKSGDADNREGIAAKLYWGELFGSEFIRERYGPPPNNLLNYGYTIIRAATARALMGSGLLPAFGLFHKNRSNAFPLADDIMEPFRPFVDEFVFDLYCNGQLELDTKTKSSFFCILYLDTIMNKLKRPLQIALTLTTASLAKCLIGSQKKLSLPELK